MSDVHKLERALQQTFHMIADDAKATAEIVSSVFEGEDEVNDEDLNKEVRSLFYALEKENLLNVRRTEYKFEGQVRRAYFWRLKSLEDFQMDDFGSAITKDDLEATKLYRQLPHDQWARRAS